MGWEWGAALLQPHLGHTPFGTQTHERSRSFVLHVRLGPFPNRVAQLTKERWPRPGAPCRAGAGPRATFLGSLASLPAAGADLFPSGADMRGGCRAPELARSHAGGTSESCDVLAEPCPEATGEQVHPGHLPKGL